MEGMLLLTSGALFLGPKMNDRLLFLTTSAHEVFGAVPGPFGRRRLKVEH